jgi:hypothetical protein
MPAASNSQVQRYVDERVRVFAEQVRKAYILAKDHTAAFADVKLNINDPATTWIDDRQDAPPYKLTAADVMQWSQFLTKFISLFEGTFADVADANAGAAKYAKVLQACVRPPEL